MRKLILIASVLVSLAAWSGGVSAQETAELRCGGKIVDLGVEIAYVLGLCGEPAQRIVTEEPVRAVNSTGASWVVGTTRVERLTYDRGSGRFPAVLKFDEGRLVSIEYDMGG